MSTRNRVALGVLGASAALVLVACSGQSPLAPSSTSAGIAAASAGSTAQGDDRAGRGATDDNGKDGAGHDAGDDNGKDRMGHTSKDDNGKDGAGHDANDDKGKDGAGHDANDDKGKDGAGHDANEDNGQDGANHDAIDDHGRDAADDNPQHDAGEATGAVAGLEGQCPDITFTVGTMTVTTNSATRFRNVACRNLMNGMTVEAKGTSAGDTLAAADVQRKP